MKKALVVFLILAVAGGVFADPIGLKVYIDGFSFGNMTDKNYEFSKGGGSLVPGVEFSKSFGAFKLTTSLQDTIGFVDPSTQDIRWGLKGAYALQLAEASKLTFSAYNKLHILKKGDDFADTKLDQITDQIGPGVRFDQTLGFGGIYAIVEVDINIHTKENTKLDLATGADDGFKVGVDTTLGLYGYVQPTITFLSNGESPAKDAFSAFNIRVGYKFGPGKNLDGRVTVAISTKENAFDAGGAGLTIQPRFTYNNIIPGLAAYADFKIGNVAVKDADIAFTPQIGVSYAF
jgi:hypothetical protein